MGVFKALIEAINAHVDEVHNQHRLRFVRAGYDDEPPFILACICGFRSDRPSMNDHLREVMKLAALERVPGGRAA